MDTEGQLYVSGDGTFYRMWLAPHELPDGQVNATMRALCFEYLDGRWAGSVLIYWLYTPETMRPREIERLLQQALERG